MTTLYEYNFPRYLAAKKTVDDRALNRHVWETLAGALPAAESVRPLRVLEVGAGIGTMLERSLEWGLLDYAEYTAIDAEIINIHSARQRLVDWGQAHGYRAVMTSNGLRLESDERAVSAMLEAADLFDFIPAHQGLHSWDLLIAHAFLDLVDITATLPGLFSLLKPGGCFYFTINFDGLTLLEPTIDPAFDGLVHALYHRTMDERITRGAPSGDSRAGRHMFSHLRAAGAEILDAGASDWVVYPHGDRYPADEAYFLHFIIHTIHLALHNHPELDAGRFKAWVAKRHQQVELGELVYIAHQIDYTGRSLISSVLEVK